MTSNNSQHHVDPSSDSHERDDRISRSNDANENKSQTSSASNDASNDARFSIDKFTSLFQNYRESSDAQEIQREQTTRSYAASTIPPLASSSESTTGFAQFVTEATYDDSFDVMNNVQNRDVSEAVRQALQASRDRLANDSRFKASPQASTSSNVLPNPSSSQVSRTSRIKNLKSVPRVANVAVPTLSSSAPSISESLAQLVAPTNSSANSPEDFLANVSLSSTTGNANPSFEVIAVERVDSNESPTDFLEQLHETGYVKESNEASADALEFLQDRSAFEKAADDAPMWLLSLFAHAILVLILAFIVIKVDKNKLLEIVSEPGFSDQTVLDEVFDPEATFDENQETEFDSPNLDVKSEIVADVPDVSAFHDESSATLALAESSLGFEPVPTGDITNWLGSLNGDDLAGRGEAKAVALATGGGTEGSEKAVALALAWLAEHQLPNGAWTFQLDKSPTCGGRCANAGTNASINAATALGLLPFLAAGHTPTTGKYKRVVAKGLNYLTQAGTKSENGLGYNDAGNMYAHGLATIALCETYAMLKPREKSKYRELGYIAQEALNFIAYAQANDGGWRYTPQQAGDTSVFGWQMMALKSGQLGGLDVSNDVVRNARDFLQNVVGFDYGSRYYYCNNSGSSNATDSIGLLCRLYLDWRVDNPQLLKGAERLSEIGPQLGNPYYNYYASQLFHNIGGEMWNKWNGVTRDALIKTQCMEGHERGSWFPEGADGHCVTGGRLYATSLNCMILEVYYRHMPLFQKMESSSQFPLDVPAQ